MNHIKWLKVEFKVMGKLQRCNKLKRSMKIGEKLDSEENETQGRAEIY